MLVIRAGAAYENALRSPSSKKNKNARQNTIRTWKALIGKRSSRPAMLATAKGGFERGSSHA
jgi:hypothetical protein